MLPVINARAKYIQRVRNDARLALPLMIIKECSKLAISVDKTDGLRHCFLVHSLSLSLSLGKDNSID